MITISILIFLAIFGCSNSYPDAEVVYRWGEHIEQFARPLGFFAEMRELAHMYTSSWMAVACIQKVGRMPTGLKSATHCHSTPSASPHAAASAAFYTMWVNSVINRKNIFNPTISFWTPAEQASILAISAAFNNTQRQWIKTNLGYTDKQINDGDRIGSDVANWVWSFRQNDGSDSTTFSYVPKCPNPPCPIGVWWPYSADNNPPVPQWADLTLLCDDPDLFDGDNNREAVKIPPPPLPVSLNANASADEIFILGRLNSTFRTDPQTEVGRWWQESSGWMYFVPVMRTINIGYPNLCLVDALRALFHASASTFDSNIVQYHYKLKYQSWRPWQRFNHDLWGTPQNPTPNPPGKSEAAIKSIPNVWLPQSMITYPSSPAGVASPNHPEYPAGHPMSVGSWTRAFELVFPDIQGTNFPSPGVQYLNKSSAVDTSHVFNMHYSNIAEINQQIVGARLYVGYHYTYSSIVGMISGRHVGHHCHKKLSDFTGDNPDYGTYAGVIPDPLTYQ